MHSSRQFRRGIHPGCSVTCLLWDLLSASWARGTSLGDQLFQGIRPASASVQLASPYRACRGCARRVFLCTPGEGAFAPQWERKAAVLWRSLDKTWASYPCGSALSKDGLFLWRNAVPENERGVTYSRPASGTGMPTLERFRARPFWGAPRSTVQCLKLPVSMRTVAEATR